MSNITNKTLLDAPIEKRYWSIGEVAAQFNVAASLLRFWETQFPELHPGKKKGSKVRFYSKEDIAVVQCIYTLLKEDRYTIEGARKQLPLKLKAYGKDIKDPK